MSVSRCDTPSLSRWLPAALLAFALAGPQASAQNVDAGADPGVVRQRIELVHQEIQSLAAAGEKPRKAVRLMKKVQAAVADGDVNRANRLLGRISAYLEKKYDRRIGDTVPAADAAAGVRTGQGAPDNIVGGGYERIRVAREGAKNGYFDPSVEYDGNGIGWMTYSKVVFPTNISTNIARSSDRGATWEYRGMVNRNETATVEIRNKTEKGTFKNEVSSLVFDPTDDARPWKVFSHKFFVRANNKPFPPAGWISYQWATTPEGPWSEGIALLGSTRYLPAPYTVEVDIAALHADLAGFVTCTEPGAMYFDGKLYMSLTGVGRKGPERVFLLRSSDHAKSWQYLGMLLDEDDAAAFGFHAFDGSALVVENGTPYLFASPGVTPGTESDTRLLHDGTMIFAFEDIDRARLAREEGVPRVVKYLKPEAFVTRRGAGQSDYHEDNVNGGIVMPQWNWAAKPEIYQIYSTGQRIAD